MVSTWPPQSSRPRWRRRTTASFIVERAYCGIEFKSLARVGGSEGATEPATYLVQTGGVSE